jgi:hypothetical protein
MRQRDGSSLASNGTRINRRTRTACVLAVVIGLLGSGCGLDSAPIATGSSALGTEPAAFIYPTDGAINVDITQSFQWTAVAGAQSYYLYVGTTLGAKDLVNSGEIQSTSRTVALPFSQTLYATIWTKLNGIWDSSPITFTTAAAPLPPQPATFTSPTDGAMNVDPTQLFQWTPVANAQAYYLYLGTTAGAKDLVNTGETQATSYGAPTMPYSATLYATIWTKLSGRWYSSAVTFTTAAAPVAPQPATLTNPVDGATNVDPKQSFQWTPIANAQSYYLYVGTTAGAKDFVDTGEIHSTSYSAPTMPYSTALYATIWTKLNGRWYSSAAIFTTAAAPLPPQPATFIYPIDGATDVDATQPFQWTAISNAQAYYLYIGTTPGGRDLVNSGELHATSRTVAGLPSALTLYATVWTKLNGTWISSGVSFSVQMPRAKLTYPVNRATNVDTALPFTWTMISGAQVYRLCIGSAVGTSDLFDTGEIQTTTTSVGNLPKDTTLYARIATEVNGIWYSSDVTFIVPTMQGSLMAPSDGAINVDPNALIAWNPVSGATSYYLYVGSQPGAKDVYNSGEKATTRLFVPTLTPNTQYYAMLWTKYGGTWRSASIGFTTGNQPPSFGPRMQEAMRLADNVRMMAPPNNIPIATTPLASIVQQRGKAQAVCSDFATELLTELQAENITARRLNIAFNTNSFDGHTLVEVNNTDQNGWVIVDPTFDLVAKRASDGLWATAQDISTATLQQSWSDITYVFLGSYGSGYANSYYIDYPLLYLTVFQPGEVFTSGNSLLPYLTEIGPSATGAVKSYLVANSGQMQAVVQLDGTSITLDVNGIDHTSKIVTGSNVAVQGSDTQLYRVDRYLF